MLSSKKALTFLLILFSVDLSTGLLSWNKNNVADSCDFFGNGLQTIINIQFEDCAPKCLATIDCTHYTWLNNVCNLKTGTVYIQDAIETNDLKKCGIVLQVVSSACRNMWDYNNEEEFSDITSGLKMCTGKLISLVIYILIILILFFKVLTVMGDNNIGGEQCVFPIYHNGREYKHCWIDEQKPNCKTVSGQIKQCKGINLEIFKFKEYLTFTKSRNETW